jgi:uncharacterized membrane protein (UPF0127 family)
MTRPKPFALALLLLPALLHVACAAPSSTAPPSPAPVKAADGRLLHPPTATLPDGTVIKLELAETPEEHRQGLMFRSHLEADHGMLFLFDQEGFPSFWMKNTWIPLDMVFLDSKGTVTHVAASVPPCRSEPCPEYTPDKPSSAVLELNAGTAARHGVRPGVTLRFQGVPGLILPH